MSRCGACGSRRAGSVDPWCPVCGAALAPDDRRWDLGGPPHRPSAPPHVSRRRVAILTVLALAVLAGIGALAYLRPGTPPPEHAAPTTLLPSPPTQDTSSLGSRTTRRFLTCDATAGKYGYADETGAMVIAPRFERAGQFLEGLAPVQVRSDSGAAAYGFIDTSGAFVIEPRFESAFAFAEGLARVEVEVDGLYRYGFIDRNGVMVIEPQYVAAWDFCQGRARVRSNGASGLAAYGFVDRTGRPVIPALFESARDFSEGLAAVAIGGKWGYIDRAGAWVIEPRFPYAESFVASGLAAVDLEESGAGVEGTASADESGLRQALIDKTGNVVWERERAEE